MSQPSTAREALIVEAIGDVARLLDRIEAVTTSLDTTCEALLLDSTTLRDDLASFEQRMTAITENAKTVAVRHIAARAAEAARQTIDQQTRAMGDAARLAFGMEVGATMQRLQTMLRPLLEEHARPWERWLTHAATAAAASAATWVLALYVVPR